MSHFAGVDTEQLSAELQQASDTALDWYRQPVEVENKRVDGFDPVTVADRTVEQSIAATLARWFPDHGVLGEEHGATGPEDRQWIIDPIDGTRAFVSGNPLWGSLVGFRRDGRPVAGWMRAPALGETWSALGPEPYFEDRSGRRPLAVGPSVGLKDATLCCTHPVMFDGPLRDGFDRLVGQVRASRYGGDCINYGLLALGFVDLVVEDRLEPYDIAPLIPIIEAAGGVVIGRGGGPAHDGGLVIAASSAQLATETLRVLTS